MYRPLSLLIILTFHILFASAQNESSVDKVIDFPEKMFKKLENKAGEFEQELDKQTLKYLSRLEKQEHKLKRKLHKKDSALAEKLFGDISARYAQMKNTQGKVNKYASVYSGHLDSLNTSLNLLKTQKATLSDNKDLQDLQKQYQLLQEKLNAADIVKKQLAARQRQLKEEFKKLGMVQELKKFRKEVYYYQAQVREYKQMFEDPSKVEQKLLSIAVKIPQFREFFAKNSMLGSLFALPNSGSGSNVSLAGLQTRAMLNQTILDRFGSGPDVTQMMQQNVATAQGQLNSLKNKVSSFSSGSFGNSSDVDMPEGFRPNQEKTKSFLQRLELGSNFQSQKARYYFPVTTDIGLSLGYRLNNNGVIGIGTSYKLGLGSGWDQIKITHQGIGLRSYIDWKLKGSLFITGGYEQNYLSAFHSIQQLQQYSAWQNSGLIGLSKKYKISKKIKGEVKLLWDFLSYQQVPRTQAVIFRVGYKFK